MPVAQPFASVRLVVRLLIMDRAQFVTIPMNKQVCKVCGLTLQGMENEVEDICVSCLADLCFPPSNNNYSTIEGMIRQSQDIPLTDNEQEETDQCQ